MRLGFMTNILVKKGMVHLDEIAEWAAAQGFEDLEVGPTVPSRIFSSSYAASGIGGI